MKSRCCNPRVHRYSQYGGRGIRVCDRWMHSFENVLADMGEKPSASHSIDRIDTNGNYEPGNCRWALPVVQGNNQRTNRLIEHEGETRTLAEWSRLVGIGSSTIAARIERGWSVERAVSVKPRYRNPPQ